MTEETEAGEVVVMVQEAMDLEDVEHVEVQLVMSAHEETRIGMTHITEMPTKMETEGKSGTCEHSVLRSHPAGARARTGSTRTSLKSLEDAPTGRTGERVKRLEALIIS